MEEGSLDEARTMLQNMLHMAPQHLAARVLLARLYESEGDHETAFTLWKQAAFHGPGVALIEDGLREAMIRHHFGEETELSLPDDVAAESEAAFPDPSEEEAPAPVSLEAEEEEESEAAEDAGPEEQPVAEPEAQPEPESEPAPEPEAAAEDEVVPALEPDAAPAPADAQADAQGEASRPEFQDLDRLIEELETAHIVPDPDIELLPVDELEPDIEDVVTETLARIYANQSYFTEAATVYDKLAAQYPDRAEEFKAKASDMRTRHS